MSLKKQAVSGIKWTGLSSMVGIGVQLLQVAVLARFLSTTDFGLMALALVVINFSQLFIDMGISNAIIHKQDVTTDQLSSLFWLNILTGWIMFVIILLVAPLAAKFYNQPQLQKIIFLVSLSFLIQPFEQQFLAIMKKEMLFNEVAKRDILAKVVGFAVAVILAYMDYGVYALVFSYLASVTIAVILVMLTGLKFHRPRVHFNLKEVKGFLSFGIYQTGGNVVNYFNYQIDEILIGKLLGLPVLGLYTVAKNIIMRPIQTINPIITQVSFPLMAKVQNEKLKFKQIYLKGLSYLNAINFQIYTFIIVAAYPIVYILFGEKWLPAVPLLKILGIYACVRSTFNPMGPLLLAKGWAKLSFFWNVFVLLIMPFSIWLGAFYVGVEGVAWILVILFGTLLLPSWRIIVFTACGAGMAEYFGQFVNPLLVAGCLFGLLSLLNLLELNSAILKLILLGGGAIVFAIPLNKYLNGHFFDEALQFLGLKKRISM